jgi:hypothetical protein
MTPACDDPAGGIRSIIAVLAPKPGGRRRAPAMRLPFVGGTPLAAPTSKEGTSCDWD